MTERSPESSSLSKNLALPATQSVKYIGSKLRLLPQILQLVRLVSVHTVLDAFAGSTRVSQALAYSGCRVLCNDHAIWSKYMGICYLKGDHPRTAYQALIDHLNGLPPQDGWFTEHYGGEDAGGICAASDGYKKPFQRHNTRRLDAIREEIDRLPLTEVERAVAITSLLLGLDAVDNTLGHFASYLQRWSARSYRTLTLQVPALAPATESHEVYQRDIFTLLPRVEADLVYFDPPYGSNNEKMPPSRVRYLAYYHLWTTICLNDHPSVFGKAMRRADSSDLRSGSVFEDFRRGSSGRWVVIEAIDRMIRETRSRWILLSYSSGGRATAEQLREILDQHGTVRQVVRVDYRKNVMAAMSWTGEWLRDAETPHQEFLFLLEKR